MDALKKTTTSANFNKIAGNFQKKGVLGCFYMFWCLEIFSAVNKFRSLTKVTLRKNKK